jgi:aminoglycoside phosphotransferase (APT) family kinase protein/putative sterol carrier protein
MFNRNIDLNAMQPKLEKWLMTKMPQARSLMISPLTRSGSGFANETFFFDMSWKENDKDKSEKLVLRWQPQDYPVFLDYDLATQFRVIEQLQNSGIPVPKTYWLETDESVLDSPFYVMGYIPGVTACEVPPYHSFGLCRDITPQQRATMWWNTLEAMVYIHKFDWRSRDFSCLGIPTDGADAIGRQLEYYERYLDWVRKEPQPILDKALEWLKGNRFEPQRLTLCWGDCRMPNMLYDDDLNVTGVLDWEMASICDPVSDLAWFFFLDWHHSTGYGYPRLEGFPDREETIQRYEELTGWKVENLFYFDVLAAFKFGVVMAKIAQHMKATGAPSPTDDFEIDNACTQRLADLLELPPPGGHKEELKIDEIKLAIQFHLTGPGGEDWYIISDKGVGTRYAGTVENPIATITADANDWKAIQSGELDRVQAFMGGKINVVGELQVMLRLEEMISELSKQG